MDDPLEKYFRQLNKSFKEAGLPYKIEYKASKTKSKPKSRGAILAELLEQAPLGFKV